MPNVKNFCLGNFTVICFEFIVYAAGGENRSRRRHAAEAL